MDCHQLKKLLLRLVACFAMAGSLCAQAPVFIPGQSRVKNANAQTGTSYPFTSADCGRPLTANNASAQAYSLPVATSLPGNCILVITNIQASGGGTVTLTPTTSTLTSATGSNTATGPLALGPGAWATIQPDSTGANYVARVNPGGGSGGVNSGPQYALANYPGSGTTSIVGPVPTTGWHTDAQGDLIYGSTPCAQVAGSTAFGECASEGTIFFTPALNADAWWSNAASHCFDVVNQTVDIGCVFGSTGTNTAQGAAVYDFSAITGTAAFKIPVKAGDTATAAGAIDFDSTNLNYHGYANGADSLFLNIAAAPTNGDLLKANVAAGNTLAADAGFLASNVVRKDTTNAAAAAMTLDLSAITGANAFKVPVIAGSTAGADGVVVYDSTNKNTHVRTNAADSIVCAFASAPTTGDLLSATVASSNTLCSDAGFLATNVVRKDAANTAAAAMTLDMSAATGATAFKVPVIAGATAGADGTIDYDSTAKITHARTNGGDSGLIGVVGKTSQKSETTTADANVLTVTPSSVAGTYRVCAVVSVSAATSGVISWTLSWTDSNGNAQSNIAQDLFQQGTAAPNTTFTTSAAGNYNGCTTFDVNNAGANIVVKWVGGGTTTAKMSATIERIQ